ncbi:MAG: family 43 glycosylhydrolase, partial [Candidatus Hydrogenedentes bacterium]|nr:family 43 glycosylhydrolase [Candidatus Hydrogenedentota bacterium]
MSLSRTFYLFLIISCWLGPNVFGAERKPCSIGDPSIISGPGGEFYIFSTGKGLPIYRSRNLLDWIEVDRVFDSVPAWAKKAVPGARAIWAPDISYFNDMYHLYYAVSTLGSQCSCIGMAVNKTIEPSDPNYKWVDKGIVIKSTPKKNDYNAIDPAVFVDFDGRVYMFWGSYWTGIKMMELDPATGKPFASGATYTAVASRDKYMKAIEGPYVIYRKGFYYLFVSWGTTTKREKSTYRVMVGRSKKVGGPYVDFNGTPMTEGGGTLVLAGYGRWRGTGHNSILRTDKGEWMVHHTYDMKNLGANRILQIRPLYWGQDGWPVVGEPIQTQGTGPNPKPTDKSVEGVWSHFVNYNSSQAKENRLLPNHHINREDSENTWSLDGSILTLTWKSDRAPGGAWRDVVFIEPGGDTYIGRNQNGHVIRGKRISDLSQTPEAKHADEDSRPAGLPTHWTVSEPLVRPVNHGNDLCYSVKDPSIVRYNGRWHLFCTIRSKVRTHQIEYLSFADWADVDHAERHVLDLTDGFCCAPQVFFFSPQKKWYMICQVQDPTRNPSLQPAYSTSDNLSDPKSWSKPKLLFDEQPANVKMWIDFWVICDGQKAYLFFTSHVGWMWQSETQLSEFPAGWSKPKVVLKGDIFEASHTYRLKGEDRFLTLVEARDKEHRRYLKAFTADRIDGDWNLFGGGPFVSPRNVRFLGSHWTDSFSHCEILRNGYDEALEIDPNNLRILFQGAKGGTKPGQDYGKIPWRLGLLKPDPTVVADHPDAAISQKPCGLFPYKRWTVGKPIFKAGPVGTFDDIAVKDPSIVRYGDNWHMFYTSKSSGKFADGVGYVSAPTLAGLNRAKRYNLSALVGSEVIAPQIFYFRPQKLWYLIAQTPCTGPSQLEPIYLTNPDITDFDGWSKPQIIKTNRRNGNAFWIDFWVICDEQNAYLFY